jgi:hypothetical protein
MEGNRGAEEKLTGLPIARATSTKTKSMEAADAQAVHRLAVGLIRHTATECLDLGRVNPGTEGFPHQPVGNTADGCRQRKSRSDVVGVSVVSVSGDVTDGVTVLADWIVSPRSAASG